VMPRAARGSGATGPRSSASARVLKSAPRSAKGSWPLARRAGDGILIVCRAGPTRPAGARPSETRSGLRNAGTSPARGKLQNARSWGDLRPVGRTSELAQIVAAGRRGVLAGTRRRGVSGGCRRVVVDAELGRRAACRRRRAVEANRDAWPRAHPSVPRPRARQGDAGAHNVVAHGAASCHARGRTTHTSSVRCIAASERAQSRSLGARASDVRLDIASAPLDRPGIRSDHPRVRSVALDFIWGACVIGPPTHGVDA
jgi:hypothetical protein